MASQNAELRARLALVFGARLEAFRTCKAGFEAHMVAYAFLTVGIGAYAEPGTVLASATTHDFDAVLSCGASVTLECLAGLRQLRHVVFASAWHRRLWPGRAQQT